MEVCRSIAEIKSALWGLPNVVLVPTMGALHAGHVALLEEARELAGETGTVVTSIFVNPNQFGPGEDYTRYPQKPEEDAAICESAGVDLVFMPSVEEIYALDASVKVHESRLSTNLCGRSRPGHFPAVCTVVLKLYHIVDPDVMVFGKKDCQQLAIIRRMARDLNMDVEIASVPTVREDDGLAVSSRNLYLSGEERQQAVVLSQALFTARDLVAKGEREARLLESKAEAIIRKAPLARIDYLSVVNAEDLMSIEFVSEAAILAVAVFFGDTRLIDNIELVPQAEGS